MPPLETLRRQVESLKKKATTSETDFSVYRGKPLKYCRKVLGVRLTPKQKEVCRAVAQPPHRVLVPSGHNVGKSFVAACLVSWWYDAYNPGLCITTAPKQSQVDDILWKEVRRVRAGRGGFAGPKSSRLQSSPEHYAVGVTARDATRFQGHHGAAVLLAIDEAEGVEQEFWDAGETMIGGDAYAAIATYNPTSQAGPTVEAERSGRWKVVRMSSLEHPNIAKELRGEIPDYPSAIRLGRLKEQLRQWSDVLTPDDDVLPTDVRLDGITYRPKSIAQCRLLGIRPTSAFDEVWSDALWQAVLTNRVTLNPNWPLQIGCDVAWYGDDYTSIHVRQGMCSLWHESHNGWSPSQTAGRLKQLSHRFAGKTFNPRRIPILVDLVGLGASVMSHAGDYSFHAIDVTLASENEDYPNLRSQLWFDAAEIAKDARRLMDVSRLDGEALASIGRQLVGVKYRIDSAGRLVVEDKDDTKKRLGRSPDDADAFNLAWLPFTPALERVIGNVN